MISKRANISYDLHNHDFAISSAAGIDVKLRGKTVIYSLISIRYI